MVTGACIVLPLGRGQELTRGRSAVPAACSRRSRTRSTSSSCRCVATLPRYPVVCRAQSCYAIGWRQCRHLQSRPADPIIRQPAQPTKETHEDTRKKAAAYMRAHPDDFLPFLPSEVDPENMMSPSEPSGLLVCPPARPGFAVTSASSSEVLTLRLPFGRRVCAVL